MSDSNPVIVWFRQDLRLADNPAYSAAAASGAPVIPVYVLDDESAGDWRMGGASRWWLHQSLAALDDSLDGRLGVFRGSAETLIPELAERSSASGVYWNRCYEPWRMDRDKTIKARLKADGREARSFNGSLLREPHEGLKEDGTPYKVFTPFYRANYAGTAPRAPGPAPDRPPLRRAGDALPLDALGLMPTVRWYGGIEAEWSPGERGAHERLERFLADGLSAYRDGRDRPDKRFVSRLSPHLHFGEVSPHQLWAAAAAAGDADDAQIEHFHRELAWREFSYALLYHWQDLPTANLQSGFDRFPWHAGEETLAAWQRGRTGYPIVDAGMRELWETGYMHNRVRMIVASFLVKNLGVHWHYGADWFWDTLLDADLANNSASWQWVAGSGADAAPFFRIFNPVTQGQKFDPEGAYVRRYVPEVAELPDRYVHRPYEAPADVLREAGVALGDSYPAPIVDLKASRESALAAYKAMRA